MWVSAATLSQIRLRLNALKGRNVLRQNEEGIICDKVNNTPTNLAQLATNVYSSHCCQLKEIVLPGLDCNDKMTKFSYQNMSLFR